MIFVSFGELKLGLVSNLDHKIFAAEYPDDRQAIMEDDHFKEWFQFRPESFSCVPTMDPVCCRIFPPFPFFFVFCNRFRTA